MRQRSEITILLVLICGFTYTVAYALFTGYGLLTCGAIQDSAGIDTHYSIATGCSVNDGAEYIPLSKWLNEQ